MLEEFFLSNSWGNPLRFHEEISWRFTERILWEFSEENSWEIPEGLPWEFSEVILKKNLCKFLDDFLREFNEDSLEEGLWIIFEEISSWIREGNPWRYSEKITWGILEKLFWKTSMRIVRGNFLIKFLRKLPKCFLREFFDILWGFFF